MVADILIMKKRGRKVEMRITTHMRKGYAPDSYTIVVNLKDFKDLALFFHDLEDLQGAPIQKAITEFQSGRSKVWPF